MLTVKFSRAQLFLISLIVLTILKQNVVVKDINIIGM